MLVMNDSDDIFEIWKFWIWEVPYRNFRIVDALMRLMVLQLVMKQFGSCHIEYVFGILIWASLGWNHYSQYTGVWKCDLAWLFESLDLSCLGYPSAKTSTWVGDWGWQILETSLFGCIIGIVPGGDSLSYSYSWSPEASSRTVIKSIYVIHVAFSSLFF